MDVIEMLPASFDDLSIHFDNRDMLGAPPAQNFPRSATISTADDQNVPRGRYLDHGRMDERFVIQELVGNGGLKLPIEDQGPAVGARFGDADFLK